MCDESQDGNQTQKWHERETRGQPGKTTVCPLTPNPMLAEAPSILHTDRKGFGPDLLLDLVLLVE
jgi:hypothetical protein